VSGLGLTYSGSSGSLVGSATADTYSKGHTAMVTANDMPKVKAFIDACSSFIRGSWTASGGRTITRTLKDGTTRTDKVFEIIISNGQLNGTPEVGTTVLVAKAKGDIALYVLSEAMGSGVSKQGVGYTLWQGTPVQQ